MLNPASAFLSALLFLSGGAAIGLAPAAAADGPANRPANGLANDGAAEIVERARANERWVRDLERFRIRVELVSDRAPETIELRRRELERWMGRGEVPDDHPELVPLQESWLEITVDATDDRVRLRKETTFGGRYELDVFDGAVRTTRSGDGANAAYALSTDPGNLGDLLLLHLAWPRAETHQFRWGNHRMFDDPSDAFQLVGREEAMGVECHVLEARAGFMRWHVGVEDGLVRRHETKAIGAGADVRGVMRNLAARRGKTLADPREFQSWLTALPQDERDAVMEEYWRDLAPTAQTMVMFELGDFMEVAPDQHVPALQRMVNPPDPAAGEGVPATTRTLRIVRFELEPSIDDAVFAIEIPAGAHVDDMRYDAPLMYRHDPERTDEEFDRMLKDARAVRREVDAAGAAIEAMVGTVVPPFPEGAHWHDSEPLSWKALRGKAVVLCFFADWCGPCRGTFATTGAWWESQRDRPENANVMIVGVHSADGTPARIAALAEARELGYPIVIDRAEPGILGGVFARALRVRGIPQAFLIGPDGRIEAHGDAESLLRLAPMLAPVVTHER